MSMKRILAGVLILVLSMLCLGAPAFADSTVENSYALEVRDMAFNRYTNTMGVLRKDASNYVLLDAAGNELTQTPYIHMRSNEDMFEVAVDSESDNPLGLIDSTGREMMPMQYGDIQYVSTEWQVGVRLEEATADNYDYKSWGGSKFYLVSAYDVYFNGQMVGSLSRLDFDYANAYGSYLYVKNREGQWAYYDSAFNKSEYAGDTGSEYDQDYKTGAVWHKGSNQQAFTAGCTLTPDEVKTSVMEVKGQFCDLQGNVLFTIPDSYDLVRSFMGDYAVFRSSDKYGLIDRQGHEVIPCEYDGIYCNEGYLASGYQVVVKNGKVGYVNAQGEVTCDFTYGESIVHSTYQSPINYLNDLEGNVIVLSGAIGELPERFASVRIFSGDCCPVFSAVNLEGAAGVVDMYGNTVIDFDGTYDDEYDFDISMDGTLVIGYAGNGVYQVYQLTHGGESAPQADAASEEAQAETAEN